MNTTVTEVKIVMYLCLHDKPEAQSREQIAQALNDAVREEPRIFNITEENILDVREYIIRGTRSPNDE